MGSVTDEEANGDPTVDSLLTDLHAHLKATGELPVDTRASQWLGEAEAVVADVAHGAPDEARQRRVRQARDLLENVNETGHPEADDHVAAARDLADRLLERLPNRG